MGKIGYKVFPSLAKDRTRLLAALGNSLGKRIELSNEIEDLKIKYESVADELASMTLRAISAEQKLANMQKPVALEPVTVKAGTAADVRRIMAEQSRKEMEEQDGIR